MALLVRVTPDLRAILAAHVALHFMDGSRLRPPHDIQSYGLMGIAAQAFDFEISIASVESIAECRGRLRRSLKAEPALIPRLAGEPIRLLARLSGPLG